MGVRVLWTGEKRSKHVSAWGYDEELLVQPLAVVSEGQSISEMGVSVRLFRSEQPKKAIAGRFWGLVTPQNLVASWRGARIIEEMAFLVGSSLCDAWTAGKRDLHSSDEKQVAKIKRVLGKERYRSIMSEQVPQVVIDAIIENAREKDSMFALYPLTQEVRAGTVLWDPAFEEVGVTHPRDKDARRWAEEEIVKQYEEYLLRYSKDHGYERECLIMYNIEGALVSAVERGLDNTHGKDIALGIAIVRAHAASSAFAISFTPFGGDPERAIHEEVNKAIGEVSKWLPTQFSEGWFIFKRPRRKPKEYVEILQQVEKRWEEFPITNPLPGS